jgi:hypothetical protein
MTLPLSTFLFRPVNSIHSQGRELPSAAEGEIPMTTLQIADTDMQASGDAVVFSTASGFRANGSAAQCRPRIHLSQVVGPLAPDHAPSRGMELVRIRGVNPWRDQGTRPLVPEHHCRVLVLRAES